MPSGSRIEKDEIIKTAFSIVREKGIEGVNAREIAKRLNCSVQPIFYRFKNMEELKQELLEYAKDYYKIYLLNMNAKGPKYRQIGMNYIRFAKEETNVYKFIFMGNYKIKIEEFAFFDKSYTEVEKTLQVQNDISREMAKKFHLKMWLFVHGISCLIATNTCCFTDEEIKLLLAEEFQILRKSLNNHSDIDIEFIEKDGVD